jgi:hypothetical protein
VAETDEDGRDKTTNELKMGFLIQLPSREPWGASESTLDTPSTFHEKL